MENYAHLVLQQLQDRQGGLLLGGKRASCPIGTIPKLRKKKKLLLKKKKLKLKLKSKSACSLKPKKIKVQKKPKVDEAQAVGEMIDELSALADKPKIQLKLKGKGINGGLNIRDLVRGAKEALGYAKQVCSLIHGSGILTGGCGYDSMVGGSTWADNPPKDNPAHIAYLYGGVESGGYLMGGKKTKYSRFLKKFYKQHPGLGVGQLSKCASSGFKKKAVALSKKPKKKSAWNKFLSKFRKANPELEFGESAKMASVEYQAMKNA
jgi:hypothetical protein